MEKSRLRPAQVGASTAAAVGGAFLATHLGVYGTIIGVGVITLMSTVGSEMLLRSLDRTKQAAQAANPRLRTARTALSAEAIPADAATDTIDTTGEQPGTANTVDMAVATQEHPPTAQTPDTLDTAVTEEHPVSAGFATDTLQTATTADHPRPATLADHSGVRPAEHESQPPSERRWPLVAGGFLASFALALAVIAGIETLTGQSLDGGKSPTVVNIFRGSGQATDEEPSTPVTQTPRNESTPASQDGATSDDPDDGSASQPEPATSPSQSAPPAGEDGAPPRDEETPLPDEEPTPPPDEEETPPAEETTQPTDDDPTSASALP